MATELRDLSLSPSGRRRRFALWLSRGAACLAAAMLAGMVFAEQGAPAEPEVQTEEKIAALLPIHGVITDVTVESLRRRIEDARAKGAATIIFDLDTPGGLVTSAIAVADLIRAMPDVHTVAWVNPNAHSGGALVAVACDEIVMARSSRIGDSQVIMGGPTGAGEIPDELKPKAYTPVLADFRNSAKLNGYSQVMCEAFVLPEREVWWIENTRTGEKRFVFRDEKIRLVDDPRRPVADALPSEFTSVADEEASTEDSPSVGGAVADRVSAGEWKLVETYFDVVVGAEIEAIQPVVRDDQLLEMSPGEATAYGFCKAVISSEGELQTHYGLTRIDHFAPTWSEALAHWLTSMWVRGFLMLIIMLGAYVEFHTPGVGVPGLVALICLAIFVGAPYLTGLANVWDIVLIGIGLALIAVELFVIPGFGIAGIAGILLFLVGLVSTFVPDEPNRSFPFHLPTLPSTMRYLQHGLITVVSSMAASLIGMVMLSRYLPRTPFFRRIVPANPMPSEVAVDDPYFGAARVGDEGVTQGPLRPSGKARFSSLLVDVVTQGEFLDPGTPVQVIERRGNHVVVRSLPGSAS